MAEERQILLELEVDKKGAQKQLEENALALELNKGELKELNEQYKKNEISTAEFAKKQLQLKQANKDLGKENRNLIKTLEAEDNSLNALRLQLSRLTAERNNTNQATEEGRKAFDRLQKEIKQTTEAIKEQEEAGGDFRRNVGNYTESIEEAALNTNVFGTSVGGIKEQFLALANPITGSIALIGALGAAYVSTGRGAQDLARASDRLSSITNDLTNSFADLLGATEEKGLLDTALERIQTSILGLGSAIRSNAIVAIKQQIRQFELLEIQSERTKKELLQDAEQLRQIRDDDTKSIQTRIDANNELGEVIRKREKEAVELQEQRIKNLKIELDLNKGDVEIKKEIARAEFELADIQEESEGFRSEQIINRIALNKELQAQLEEEAQLERDRIEQNNLPLLEAQKRIEAKQLEVDEVKMLTFDAEQAQIESAQVVTDSQRKQSEIRKQIQALETENSLLAAGQIAGALSGLFEQNTAAFKATASIEAAISTYLAINKTLSAFAGVPIPGFAIAQAIGIGIQGFANVAKINGLGGGGGGGANSQTVSAPRIDSRTSLSGAFDRNQLTGQANQAQDQTSALSSQLSRMPAPVVKVTDINKTQKKTSQVKVTQSL